MATTKVNEGGGQPGGNGTTTPCAETKKVFSEFSKELENTIKANISANEASNATYVGKKRDLCGERRSYNKINKAYAFYSNTYYCQAIILGKDVEQTQEMLKKQTELASTVKKGFEGIVTSLKTLKEKAKMVHELSCKVDTACYDSANTTAKGIINTAIDPDKINETKENRNKFSKEGTRVLDAVDQACETAVNVAGIFSYTNVLTIKEHTDGLKANADLFKADIETNIKNLDGDLKNAQKALTEVLVQKSIAEAACSYLETIDDGNRQLETVVIAHIGNGDSPTPGINEIDKNITSILKP